MSPIKNILEIFAYLKKTDEYYAERLNTNYGKNDRKWVQIYNKVLGLTWGKTSADGKVTPPIQHSSRSMSQLAADQSSTAPEGLQVSNPASELRSSLIDRSDSKEDTQAETQIKESKAFSVDQSPSSPGNQNSPGNPTNFNESTL